VEDLDREVIPPLPQYLRRFLRDNNAGPVVRIDDVVANVEVPVQRFYLGTGLCRRVY